MAKASPVKRIRVSDFSVTNSRYEEEFLEISEIASGEFGCVKRARHRLDGVDYAVKISKKNLDSSPHLLDDDLDEHLAFVHKASVLSRRTPTNKQERSRDIGIQTDAYRHFLQGTHTEPQADTKVDFLGDDPFFFEECDDHVQVVSGRWYKSLRKLVKHLTSIVSSVKSYQDRRELVSVRAFFVWITQNIRWVGQF